LATRAPTYRRCAAMLIPLPAHGPLPAADLAPQVELRVEMAALTVGHRLPRSFLSTHVCNALRSRACNRRQARCAACRCLSGPQSNTVTRTSAARDRHSVGDPCPDLPAMRSHVDPTPRPWPATGRGPGTTSRAPGRDGGVDGRAPPVCPCPPASSSPSVSRTVH